MTAEIKSDIKPAKGWIIVIDTQTLFNELARIMNDNADDFYCRVSLDRYFEPNRDKDLDWTWKAVVGHKYDHRFYVTVTSFGVTNASSLLSSDYSEETKKHAYQLLNSYANYLSTIYDKVVAKMNQNK